MVSKIKIPYGYCRCGCGQKTTVSPCTDRYAGYVRGVPRPTATSHTMEQRFWSKVEKTEGCWNWKPTLGNKNRGKFFFNGSLVFAYRVSYQIHTGKVPTISILHSCDNGHCVRPDHLREGTQKENSQDMISRGRCAMSNKTHCRRGHPYDDTNTYVEKHGDRGQTRRHCRTCVKARIAAFYARNPEKRHAKN